MIAMKTRYSTITLAQNVIELCRSKGIIDIVITPGSRNAPLTISFANNPAFNAYSIVDERCAAFFALGMAQQLKKPVALCCTSGSALLNYYPAISEAFYSDIPLVVISADRPVERIDIGDGQTIRQKNVFQNHILYSANLYSELVLSEATNDPKIKQKKWEAQKNNEREINLALNTAIEQNGPVHLNVPFYEPLYDTTETCQVEPLKIEPIRSKKTITAANLSHYADRWNQSKRKLVLVGVNAPNAIAEKYLDWLARDPSVLVLCETTSNLHHRDFVTRIDNLIAPIENAADAEQQFKQLQPDILLTFGGMVVSKKIKAFLRNYQPQEHWHVDEKKALNTYFCLNKHFDVSPSVFFQTFESMTKPVDSPYRQHWLSVRQAHNTKHDQYMQTIPFSDLKAFHHILKEMNHRQVLQLSNSSIVRYAQLFKLKPELEVYCNRGTSGIDGSVSTAIGAALKAAIPTTLICGDLSFFYDSNALWNTYIPKNLKIIILNNGGGGIFRILPGKKSEDYFHQFFETRHQLHAEHLSKMYQFGYQKANNERELETVLPQFFATNDRPQLLEVFTPTEVNDKILLNYFTYIKS